MTVGEIIEAVRFCYDEEALDGANFNNASAQDNTYMDNIIKAKIGDAVRWICLYSPAELLGGSDETTGEPGHEVQVSTGILVDMPNNGTPIVPTAIGSTGGGRVTLPADFIKLARIRVAGWSRAIKNPIGEDSEEYLQQYDENGAKGTADRPQAAIIDKATKEIEVWPTGTSVEYTYVAATDGNSFDVNIGTEQEPVYETHYPIPPRVKTAFIYYLAFLVLSAYEDSRAKNMFEIAKMNIGKNG